MKKIFMFFLLITGIASNLFAEDRFVRDNTKEVVIDTKTNLMWQDNNDSSTLTMDWEDAIDYCENLTLGEYENWRLPNNNELFGVVDRSRYNPAIDPTFQNVVSEDYWSSTTDNSDSSVANSVNFNIGYNIYSGKSYNYYVRCVRDNK